jgi:hypothetical protein
LYDDVTALTSAGTSSRCHGRAWRTDAASKRFGWFTMTYGSGEDDGVAESPRDDDDDDGIRYSR